MSESIALVEISADGKPLGYSAPLTPPATEVSAACASLLQKHPRPSPWTCYFAQRNGELIGTCGFKMAPADNRVEIAYFTFPPNEGRGVATTMAQLLIELARHTQPGIVVVAQTLQQQSASTTILLKLGFVHASSPVHDEDGPVWEWELPASQLTP